jgi:hypothetical protein
VAGVIVNSLILGLKSTFEDSRAPYGGQITSLIGCENKKFLKENLVVFEGDNTKFLLAVAGERQTFGVCVPDQIKFVSGVWTAYDKSKGRVIFIKLFKPIENLNDIGRFQAEITFVLNKSIEFLKKN